MARPIEPDPYLVSTPEAGVLLGISEEAMYVRLRQEGFRAAVVADTPGRTRISVPRLCRRVHGDDYKVVLPTWLERVKAMRGGGQTSPPVERRADPNYG